MIPENLQAFARELGALAAKHNLHTVQGKFRGSLIDDPWRADVNFHWAQGRHGAESGVILLSSTQEVLARIEAPPRPTVSGDA